eukprot:c12592_g1_i1.p1 GENE.c12592_g1_i1~~c12592_g1_i1.p1  ORF type:complete len:585 (+),score=206.00 c12592_g1_i1:17-1771(+)
MAKKKGNKSQTSKAHAADAATSQQKDADQSPTKNQGQVIEPPPQSEQPQTPPHEDPVQITAKQPAGIPAEAQTDNSAPPSSEEPHQATRSRVQPEVTPVEEPSSTQQQQQTAPADDDSDDGDAVVDASSRVPVDDDDNAEPPIDARESKVPAQDNDDMPELMPLSASVSTPASSTSAGEDGTTRTRGDATLPDTGDVDKAIVERSVVSKIALLEQASKSQAAEAKRIAKVVKTQTTNLKQTAMRHQTEEARINAVLTAFENQVKENLTLQRQVSQLEDSVETLTHDKRVLTNELSKTQRVIVTLENLCKDLRKHNKQISDMNLQMLNEEQRKREENEASFSATVKNIHEQLNFQEQERLKHMAENLDLRQKLQEIINQFEVTQQHFDAQHKATFLEFQLSEAKLRQQEAISAEESLLRERIEKELMLRTKELQTCQGELSLYGQRFEEYRVAMTKSSDTFTTLRTDMEQIAKQVKQKEKENLELRKKQMQTDATLLDQHAKLQDHMVEVEGLKKQVTLAQSQREKLEGLCRTLQQDRKTNNRERTLLVAKLKELGLEWKKEEAGDVDGNKAEAVWGKMAAGEGL